FWRSRCCRSCLLSLLSLSCCRSCVVALGHAASPRGYGERMGPRTYPHGVTSWIDTEQPDLAAARAFYAGLFGWQLNDAMPAGAPGSYLIATIDGLDVAAIAPLPELP